MKLIASIDADWTVPGTTAIDHAPCDIEQFIRPHMRVIDEVHPLAGRRLSSRSTTTQA